MASRKMHQQPVHVHHGPGLTDHHTVYDWKAIILPTRIDTWQADAWTCALLSQWPARPVGSLPACTSVKPCNIQTAPGDAKSH